MCRQGHRGEGILPKPGGLLASPPSAQQGPDKEEPGTLDSPWKPLETRSPTWQG